MGTPFIVLSDRLEDSLKIEISDLGRRGVVLSEQQRERHRSPVQLLHS